MSLSNTWNLNKTTSGLTLRIEPVFFWPDLIVESIGIVRWSVACIPLVSRERLLLFWMHRKQPLILLHGINTDNCF